MLDGEDHEITNYKNILDKASNTAIKYQLGLGASVGLLWSSMLWAYSLGFWYGAKLISDQVLMII